MSNHHYSSQTVPTIQLGSRAASVERTAGLIGGLSLLLCVAAFFINRAHFFQSYLFAFFYWGGFSIGGIGILLLNNVVGGKWGVLIRRLLEAKMRTLPVVALLFVPIAIGIPYLYPWANDALHHSKVLQHKAPYLNTPFFLIRAVFYFALWTFWGYWVQRLTDQQDRTGDPSLVVRLRQISAPGLLLFTFTATFAFIDWILSADAEFFSTVFGAILLFSSVLQTFALSIMVLILVSQEDRWEGRVQSKVLHDLGNMMFAFTIFWTYLSASQLIIVWPANLPMEIGYYIARTQGFWKVMTWVIGLTMFAIPFLALLSQDRKRDPKRLIRVAIWLLCANLLFAFWAVIPMFRANGFAIYWTDIVAFFGVGGVWVYAYLGQLRKRPLMPLSDPRLPEPIVEEEALA